MQIYLWLWAASNAKRVTWGGWAGIEQKLRKNKRSWTFQNIISYILHIISKQLDERETTHIHLWFKYTGNPGPLIDDLGDWESKETGQPGHQALELSFSPVGGYVDLERSYNNKLLKPPKMKAMRYIVLHLDRNVLISSTLV